MQSSKHERDATDDVDPASKIARSQDVKASSASNAAAAQSLAGFWRLPQELRIFILELACYRKTKPKKDTPTSSSGQYVIDTSMVANLVLVSRQFHSTFHPLLYSRVRLTRPSILKAFAQALVLRPSNAQLVESLHLGPDNDLTKGWWPLPLKEEDEEDSEPPSPRPVVHIKTSLAKRDEAAGLLPRWAQPNREFSSQQPAQSCQDGAVAVAIKVALDTIGVDPSAHFLTRKNEIIGIDDWTERLFEAQAVLDLYLGTMKRTEEDSRSLTLSCRSEEPASRAESATCLSGQCGHYPTLILTGFPRLEGPSADGNTTAPIGGKDGGKDSGKGADEDDGATEQEASSQEKQSRNTVEITREEAKAHLARRSAYTDHFEHPIMYARTDMRILCIMKGKVSVDYHREETDEYYGNASELDYMSGEWDSDPEEAAFRSEGVITRPSAANGSSHSSSSSSFPSSHCVSPSSSSKRGHLLAMEPTNRHRTYALACEVLRMTSEVRNLSLTGYFHHVLRRPDMLSAGIRYLSIGPLAPSSASIYWLRKVKLPTVEKLRFCGQSIDSFDDELARHDDEAKWPSLKTVQWDFAKAGTNTEGFFEEVLNNLQGRRRSTTSHTSDNDLDLDPAVREVHTAASKNDATERSKPHPRHIEARLAPPLVTSILALARTPDVRSAWINGTPVSDAPHVVHLVESRAAKKSLDGNGVEKYKQDISVLRKESRLWWEERADECPGRRGAHGGGVDVA